MNSGAQSTDEPDMAHEILAYLHKNPNAQDSLEGIVEWWLLEQKIVHQTERVRAALAQLVERGLVVARTGRDSRTHYAVNQDRLEEIESLLRTH